jgi:hypothetical protein
MYFGGERLGTKKTKKTFFLIDLNESVFFLDQPNTNLFKKIDGLDQDVSELDQLQIVLFQRILICVYIE